MKYQPCSLLLLTALLQWAAAEQASPKNRTNPARGHIVVLKPDLEERHLDDHIEWVKSIHKRSVEGGSDAKGVKEIYRGASYNFHAYAGDFPPQVLDDIKRHEHVDFVEEDRDIFIQPVKREENAGGDTPAVDRAKVEKNKGPGLLSRGQAFNTLLDKGLTPNAVLLPTRNGKRNDAVQPAGDMANHTMAMFPFKGPDGNVTDVDLMTYFDKTDPDTFKEEILAALAESKQNTTKPTTTKPNVHARDEGQLDCTGSLTSYYKYTEDFNYLNQAEMSSNALTFVAILNIERQWDSPTGFEFNMQKYKKARFARDFGDRWIHSFYTGGKMVARLSFTSKGTTSKNELKAHAESSLRFWGATGDISASIKKSMEDVGKHATVEISLFYQGDVGRVLGQSGSQKISGASAAESFEQVKSWADEFIKNACRHNYQYRPRLEEYSNTDNFPDDQEVPDYSTAHLVSHRILKDLVRISEMKKYIEKTNLHNNALTTEVDLAEIKMVELSKKWVKSAVEHPEEALDKGAQLLTTFGSQFFDKYKPHITYDLYVSGLEVVYGNRPPPNRVIDIAQHIEDINHNFHGEFVWLVPIYTANADDACTSFSAIVDNERCQSEPSSFFGYKLFLSQEVCNILTGFFAGSDSELKDLAKGAGGKNRYLKCEKVPGQEKIRRVALHRGTTDYKAILQDIYHGFRGRTGNINKGRGDSGDSLYLMWAYDRQRDQKSKSKPTPTPSNGQK